MVRKGVEGGARFLATWHKDEKEASRKRERTQNKKITQRNRCKNHKEEKGEGESRGSKSKKIQNDKPQRRWRRARGKRCTGTTRHVPDGLTAMIALALLAPSYNTPLVPLRPPCCRALITAFFWSCDSNYASFILFYFGLVSLFCPYGFAFLPFLIALFAEAMGFATVRRLRLELATLDGPPFRRLGFVATSTAVTSTW